MPAEIPFDDSRIAHVRICESLTVSSPLRDYHQDVALALKHESGVVHVYSFDGELDDQIRLEHLLLVFPATSELVVVAGQRIDGEDTFVELSTVIRRTLQTELLGSGTFSGHPNIHLVKGGPLRSPGSPKYKANLRDAVNRLLSVLSGRPFVFQSNTSATLPEALLSHPDCPTVKAMLFTCDLALRPTGIIQIANGSWNAEAWLLTRKLCQERGVPFISIHGSTAGYQKQILNQLGGWAEIMFESAETAEDVRNLQKIVRFSMAMNLIWAARGYGAAKELFAAEMLQVVRNLLQKEGYMPEPSRPSPSDDWTLWAVEDVTEYDDMKPSNVVHRFLPVSNSANCPIDNTVGDFCASGLDTPEIAKSLTFLKLEGLEKGEDGVWQGRLGGDVAGESTHFIAAYADEAETLDRSWNRIQMAREERRRTSDKAPLPVLDEDLKREWRAYRRTVKGFVSGSHCSGRAVPPPIQST